jgi:hypothetical protein
LLGVSERFSLLTAPSQPPYAFKQTESDEGDEDSEGEEFQGDEDIASTGWETMLEGLVQAAPIRGRESFTPRKRLPSPYQRRLIGLTL